MSTAATPLPEQATVVETIHPAHGSSNLALVASVFVPDEWLHGYFYPAYAGLKISQIVLGTICLYFLLGKRVKVNKGKQL